MTQQDINSNSGDPEISLLDIINFLQGSWKKLAVGSIVGAVLGFGNWFFLDNYSAEYVLLNNNNNNNNDNDSNYALDIISWKRLQKSLPNLANQIIDENKVPESQASLYKSMSNDQWWQNNTATSYAISKADTKDLATITKDFDFASTTILSLTLNASGNSKENALKNVRVASQFLRSGGAYLQLRSLLNGYESQTISFAAEVRQKIASTQTELGYQRERLKSLEELHKRYPNNPSVTIVTQQIESGDTKNKYQPLTSQIIAANMDINQSKEDIVRLQGRLDKITLTKTFLEQALPLQDQTFDGLALDKQLLDVESNLRAKLAKDDSNGVELLNTLHSQLLTIQVRFSKGLDANTAPTSNGKKGMIKSIAGGLAAVFFLMLFVLLGQRVLQGSKSGGAK